MPASSSEKPRRLGPYEILNLIGKGSMAQVYLAKDREGKSVAVKILSDVCTANPELVNRFMREARLAVRVNHPNVVRVLDYGEENGVLYLVMEYVKGKSLGKIVQDQGPLQQKWALKAIRQAAKGLLAAHENNVVHRDIKPDNILVADPDETGGKPGSLIKLTDLGLAKDLSDSNALTIVGAIVGSPRYLSPEQCRDSSTVDNRADIFSLGTTFYYLLTGVFPFKGNNHVEVIDSILKDPLPPVQSCNPTITDEMSQVLETMTLKDRNQRYPSCRELIEDLESVYRGEPPKHAASLLSLPETSPRARPLAANDAGPKAPKIHKAERPEPIKPPFDLAPDSISENISRAAKTPKAPSPSAFQGPQTSKISRPTAGKPLWPILAIAGLALGLLAVILLLYLR